MKKRVLPLVMALVLCASLLTAFPVTASAATDYTVSVTTGQYFAIKNKGSGKYLNVYCNRSADNTNINLWEADGTDGEDYLLTKTSSGYYVITPRCAPNSAVNVWGDYAVNGSNVCVWSKTGHSTQGWFIEYVPSQDGYILRSANNKNYVLTATGSSNGSNVCIQSYDASNSRQIWASSAFSAKSTSTGTTAKDVAGLESLMFYPNVYYTLYGDLQNAFGKDASALQWHYNGWGKGEGRVASPIFDPAFYLNRYSDLAKAFGANNYAAAYDHFVNYGFWERRQGSPYFSVEWYLNNWSDLKAAFGNDILAAARHYCTYGINEDRTASPTGDKFDPSLMKNFDTQTAKLIWPLADGKGSVSSNAGVWRSGYCHVGTDIAAAHGTKILAVANGTVTAVGYDSARGYYVTIEHGDYTCTYQHMAYAAEVRNGNTVSQGQVIGYVGNTGESYGAHLHFEISLTSTVRRYGTVPNYLYNNVNTLGRKPTYYYISRGGQTGSYYALNLHQVN